MSALLAAVLVAGTTGGAAGSLFTANALAGRGGSVPAAVAAAPVVGQNPVVTDPGNLKAIFKQVSPAVVNVQTSAALGQGRDAAGAGGAAEHAEHAGGAQRAAGARGARGPALSSTATGTS